MSLKLKTKKRATGKCNSIPQTRISIGEWFFRIKSGRFVNGKSIGAEIAINNGLRWDFVGSPLRVARQKSARSTVGLCFL